MKTLQLDLKKKVLLVEVPKNGELTAIGNNKEVYYAIKHDGKENYTKIADGKLWKLLCKASDLTEDIASELVENYLENMDSLAVYRKYNVTEEELQEDAWAHCADSALDSFKSTVESKDKTFDLSNALIFELVN